MMPSKLLVVAAIGLAACGCSYSSTTTQPVVPAPVVVASGNPSEQACASYGLTPGTNAFNQCVSRDAEARVRAASTTTTVYSPAPATVTYTPAATRPPAGVQAFRDEYGFRYDGQGNRIDRYGNIISPQSTAP